MEKYLRETLEVHKSIKKIGIRVSASIDGVDEFVTTLRDESTLWGLLGQLEWHREAILSGKKVQLRGKLISLKGPTSYKKACRPRNGKQRENEQNFKDLVTALFGVKPATARRVRGPPRRATSCAASPRSGT